MLVTKKKKKSRLKIISVYFESCLLFEIVEDQCQNILWQENFIFFNEEQNKGMLSFSVVYDNKM